MGGNLLKHLRGFSNSDWIFVPSQYQHIQSYTYSIYIHRLLYNIVSGTNCLSLNVTPHNLTTAVQTVLSWVSLYHMIHRKRSHKATENKIGLMIHICVRISLCIFAWTLYIIFLYPVRCTIPFISYVHVEAHLYVADQYYKCHDGDIGVITSPAPMWGPTHIYQL